MTFRNRKLNLFAIVFLAAAASACHETSSTVTGTVKLAPELQGKVGPQAALYLIARSAGAIGGPPIAVKRFTQPLTFPIEFTMSSADAMMPDAPFSGSITLSARVSQSGSAMPVSPGDLEMSSPPLTTQVGGKHVEIVLDHVHP